MPPNVVDITPANQPGNEDLEAKGSPSRPAFPNPSYGSPQSSPGPQRNVDESDMLKTFMSSLNTAGHILIGIVVTLSLMYSFRSGLPLGATPLHIVLCVIGYQLLMAEAILGLSNDNGWSAHLNLVDKRRAHLILQILGSGLAIAGSFVKILDKSVHWNSLHGKFALVALVFTSVSLVNGLTSLWAFELRRLIPQNLSKLTHICFGTVGFMTSCITLCYGYDKQGFKIWLGDNVAYALIACTSALCFITIVTPLFNFYRKSSGIFRR